MASSSVNITDEFQLFIDKLLIKAREVFSIDNTMCTGDR